MLPQRLGQFRRGYLARRADRALVVEEPALGGHGGRPPKQQERPDGKKILEQISSLTGGRLFEVSKKETVDKIYADIQEELRNQYRIGYTPTKNLEAGYHKIHLATNNKDLKVQARDGYYSSSQSSPSASR